MLLFFCHLSFLRVVVVFAALAALSGGGPLRNWLRCAVTRAGIPRLCQPERTMIAASA
jgi:hypothetical protein